MTRHKIACKRIIPVAFSILKEITSVLQMSVTSQQGSKFIFVSMPRSMHRCTNTLYDYVIINH
jgi:hypothetical protein